MDISINIITDVNNNFAAYNNISLTKSVCCSPGIIIIIIRVIIKLFRNLSCST